MLISGPSKAVLDRQRGALDQEIKGLLQHTSKMDEKNLYANVGFLNESFTLHKTEELEKISLRTTALKEDTNMFSSELREFFGLERILCSLLFDYDYTIKLLLTN